MSGTRPTRAATNIVEVYIGYLRKKIDAPFGLQTLEHGPRHGLPARCRSGQCRRGPSLIPIASVGKSRAPVWTSERAGNPFERETTVQPT